MPRAPPEQSFFVGMDAYYMAPKKPKQTSGSSSKSVKSSSASVKESSSSTKSKSTEGSSTKQDSKSKKESKTKTSNSNGTSSNSGAKQEELPKQATVTAPPEPPLPIPIAAPTKADKDADIQSMRTTTSKKSSDPSVMSSSTSSTSTKKKAKGDPQPIAFFPGMEAYYGTPKPPKSEKSSSIKTSKSSSNLDRNRSELGVRPSFGTFESAVFTDIIDIGPDVANWIETEPSTSTSTPSPSSDLVTPASSLPKKSTVRPSLETSNLSRRITASYSIADTAGSPITEKRRQNSCSQPSVESNANTKQTNTQGNTTLRDTPHTRTKKAVETIYTDATKAFVMRNGKKHHTYAASRAPYPRSYDSKATDLETTDHLCFMKLCNSVTFHDFSSIPDSSRNTTSGSVDDRKPPPRTVLDLGCGNGLWVLDAAKAWPDAHFVGLDLVPIQPNLDLVARDLRTRIRWVNANFLDSLPFPTSYFDFVHIRRIARGVPEDKWHSLLDEVSRVLRPDGAIEIIEDDLIFPGGSTPCNCHHLPGTVNEDDGFVPGSSPKSPDQHGLPSPPTTPTLPTWDLSHNSDPCDHSELEQAYNDMHSDRFINIMPLSILANTLPQYFRDVRSHAPILINFPPPEEEMWPEAYPASQFTPSDTRSVTPLGRSPLWEHTMELPSRLGVPRIDGHGVPSPVETYSYGSDAGSSFGGSPVESSTPSSPHRRIEAMLSVYNPSPTTSTTMQRFPHSPTTTISDTEYNHHPPPGGWHTLRLDMNSLLQPSQPFFMLDRCRMPALMVSPVGNSTTTNVNASMLTKIPNTNFNVDLQSLTLGLTLSVTEVLECKESIWEYLVKSGRATETISIPASDSVVETSRSPDRGPNEEIVVSPQSEIRDSNLKNGEKLVDRAEFEQWITKYERDMTTRIGMAKALQRRFGWNARGSTATATSPSSHPPRAGVNVNGQVVLPTTTKTSPAGEGMAAKSSTRRSMEQSLLPYDYEEEEEEDVDDLLGLKEELGLGFEHSHASSVSVLGHEGDGRPIQQVYNGQSESHRGIPTMRHLSGSGMPVGMPHLAKDRQKDESPRLSRCIKIFVAWNNKSD
ncbi:hypothetical protein FRC15_011810 [Serendipita sp. 397]|nr:hypothetical protein FRC15_011810 [Serendipita sp. 397]